MNISKSKLGLIGGMTAVALTVFFSFSTVDSQSVQSQHAASDPKALDALLTPSTATDTVLDSQKNNPPSSLRNQIAIHTFYDERISDQLLSKLKAGQMNLEKNGHIVPYDDPMQAFWSLEEFNQLAKFEVTHDVVNKQLGYTPLAHQLGDEWKTDNQLLLGQNESAEVITRLSQADKQVIIMQKKWNGTEKMFSEYVNYRIGSKQNVGAIYQQYDNKKLQNITLIDPQFSYTIYTLNFSQRDLDQLLSRLSPAT